MPRGSRAKGCRSTKRARAGAGADGRRPMARAALTLARRGSGRGRGGAGETFNAAQLQDILQRRAPIYDKSADGHYNLISALHKIGARIRSRCGVVLSRARMMDARRRPAVSWRGGWSAWRSRDIGLADPQALVICNARQGRLRLPRPSRGRACDFAQAVIYLATAPKSNAAYKAFGAAMARGKGRRLACCRRSTF